MHGSLGPGEQPNNPITVHMLNGKDKTSFGFSGMMERDGKVTALWQPFKTKRWIKVEQIAPYEWREVQDAADLVAQRLYTMPTPKRQQEEW